MKIFFAIVLLAVMGCNQSKQPAIPANRNDSVRSSRDTAARLYRSLRASISGPTQCARVQSVFLLPPHLSYDSSFYCQGTYLFITDCNEQVIDSLLLSTESCSDGILMTELSRELRLKAPLYSVSSPSGSDNYLNEFFEYRNGRLHKVFEISDGKPTQLERKDNEFLTGLVKGKDEVVNAVHDYPVKISLRDYQVIYEIPDQEQIAFHTEALENFAASKTFTGKKQDQPVKAGTQLLVDSFYRKTGTVRIMVEDTLVLYVPLSKVKGKLRQNSGG